MGYNPVVFILLLKVNKNLGNSLNGMGTYVHFAIKDKSHTNAFLILNFKCELLHLIQVKCLLISHNFRSI